jgi:hypothetical protein
MLVTIATLRQCESLHGAIVALSCDEAPRRALYCPYP